MTRHGFLWRAHYSKGDTGYYKRVRAWTAWGAKRLGGFYKHAGWTLTVERRRGRLWWLLRFVRAYRHHGITIRRYGVRKLWSDAMYGRRVMNPAEQWKLGPLRRNRG